MSGRVVQHAEGFELPESQRRSIRWMIYLGFLAVGLGILNGLGQALNYADIDILRYFPGMRNYYQGLTAHGVLNAIIFTFAFANGFLALTTARGLGRPLSDGLLNAALGAKVLGALLAGYGVASGQASVLYTFYAPLQAHWTFYLGLTLLVVSTWIIAAQLFVALRAWRREHPGERIPLLAFISVVTYAMWTLASLGVAVSAVGFLLPWSMGLMESTDPLLTRTLFWYTGHPIVYFWLLPAYVSWYLMVPRHTDGKLFSDPVTRIVFLLFLLLSIPTGFHHQFTDPGIGTGMKAVHTVFTFGVFFPSMITAFTVVYALEIGGRRRGGTGLFGWIRKLNWSNPALVAQVLAMLTFTVGGIGGLINASFSLNQVIHNTTWIPGHFHLTVGTAVTMSFMGIAYWLVPYLTRKALVWRRAAVVQSWLYFVGASIMAWGLKDAGLGGMPRRTSMMEAPFEAEGWAAAGSLVGVGGTLMFVGGALFFVVLGGTLLLGRRGDADNDLPLTVTARPAAREGWELRLDRIGVWVLAAVILILLAYGPFLMEYLPPELTSPPYRFY